MGFWQQLLGTAPTYLLEPPSDEENKKELAMIKATPAEIKRAQGLVNYVCTSCGYHQDTSWDGKLRKCKGCGSWLRYWKLSERIIELRELEYKSRHPSKE